MTDELRRFVEAFAAHLQRRVDEQHFNGLDFKERAGQEIDEETENLRRRQSDIALAAARAVWEVREALLAAARGRPLHDDEAR